MTKELEVRSESKKIVPHENGFATNLLFPESEGLQTSKKAEVSGNVQHESWQKSSGAAGNNSVHNAHLKHRELEYVDGQKGRARRAARPRRRWARPARRLARSRA